MSGIPTVGDETIRGAMDRRARETPDDVYCVFEDRSLTFAALDAAVNRVANALLARGLAKGDRVALMLPSHPDHIIAILALAKVGLVRVPVNVHLKGPALAFLFEQFAPKALIADSEYEPLVAPLLAQCPLALTVWRGAGAPGPTFADLASHPDAAAPAIAPGPDDIIASRPARARPARPRAY